MTRSIFILGLMGILFLGLTSSDKLSDKDMLIGSWTMEKVLRPDGSIKKPTVLLSVMPNGTFRSHRKGVFFNINGTWTYDTKSKILKIKGSGIKEQFKILEASKKRITAKRIHEKWRKYFLIRKN
jgi:hypothetical protein